MSETPKIGDAWERYGERRVVVAVNSRGDRVTFRLPSGRDHVAWVSTWADWSRHATRVASHEDPGDVA